ncbi:ABC transporter transmembrane domain-containing protein [Paracoccus rhizosphaerae]|uniref:ABC transporter transmembrane domain-containing protein n=1 Tax=Paracoccus rhizosphaerae TaxID=1133347 RepID=A0ABV6CET5_9RHOB|nr:ABC transporter ATP-binding protein [Paracoccus rhizosphaerae]
MPMPPLLNRSRRRGMALVTALTLMQGLAAAAGAFATRTLFEALHTGGTLPAGALATLIAAGIVIALARVSARCVGERVGQDYARCIRASLFDHAARLPLSTVARRRAGSMPLRFVGDMTAFRNWPAMGLPRLVSGVVLVPVTLAVLYILHPVFGLAVGVVTLPCIAANATGGMLLPRLQRRLRARRARIALDMAERMSIAPQLDRMGRRGKELALLDKRTRRMVRTALRHRLAVESLKALPDAAAGIAAVLIVVLGHRAGQQAGTIAAGLAALGLLLTPLRDLGGVWNHRSAFQAAARKVRATLAQDGRGLYRAGLSLERGPVAVAVCDLALPSGRTLDRCIDAGGRATLSLSDADAAAVQSILLGLDDPGRGQVLLDEVDLRDLSRGSLRRRVMPLGPAQVILRGSLRRALTMGCTPPDDARLERLARAEGLGPLLDRIGGLDGGLRERGQGLSPAELTAIGLVRIRLQRPGLIVVQPHLMPCGTSCLSAYLKRHPATVLAIRTDAIAGCETGPAHSA